MVTITIRFLINIIFMFIISSLVLPVIIIVVLIISTPTLIITSEISPEVSSIIIVLIIIITIIIVSITILLMVFPYFYISPCIPTHLRYWYVLISACLTMCRILAFLFIMPHSETFKTNHIFLIFRHQSAFLFKYYAIPQRQPRLR